MNCFRITLIIFTVLLSLVYYNLFIVDPELSWKMKLLHFFVVLRSYYTGAAFGKFNRNYTTGVTQPFEKDGIVSSFIHVPHYLEKDHQVLTKFFINKNQTSSTLLLFIHGGGFVYEESFLHDNIFREYSKSGIKILSVIYRLSPEYKFPVPVHDTISVMKWLKEEIKKENSVLGKVDKIVISGDSAGGNLAGVGMIMNKELDINLNISKQILIYPTFFSDLDHANIDKDHYLLTSRLVNFFIKAYLGENPREHKKSLLLNPMNYNGSLGFLPKTLIITATFDPLKNEGELYHNRLLKDKVNSRVLNFNSIHGFITFSFDDHYQECLKLMTDEILN